MTIPPTLSTLPALDAAERAHAEQVTSLVRGRIEAAGGWLGFADFMRLVLYEPGLGYYSSGATKFGAAGDFVTAPEMSPLFGRCLARQCADVLAVTGGDLLEFGAGSGALAAVLLEELAALGTLPDRYRILEVSADLRARQRTRLAALPAALASRVEWLDRWPAQRITGVVVANEVLDAMPVERFVLRAGAGAIRVIDSLGVALDSHGALVEATRTATPALANAVRLLERELPQQLPDNYHGEICLELEGWLAGLGAVLRRGVVLLIDYGLPRPHLYHPDRTAGTLQCHFRHRAHGDPLRHVGLQDITAWVDFTRVAESGSRAALELQGFVTQAGFLIGCGMENVLATARDERERLVQAGEARRLMMPGEMGEAFKVMALGRDYRAPLRGFGWQDLRGSL
ncbi:MAG TPA: SAM-dependent methyltransferase [Steroidobacteraceae bacterium]|nr:SAM-dependent methyltransferase [Steroidobacteraceae bacterium]